MCRFSINPEYFDLEVSLGLTFGKYFIKTVFDMKKKIDAFEVSIRPNFNKF